MLFLRFPKYNSPAVLGRSDKTAAVQLQFGQEVGRNAEDNEDASEVERKGEGGHTVFTRSICEAFVS